MTRRLQAVIFLFALAAPLEAQQPTETLPGFRPSNLLEARGIDNVNLFNGDPGVVIPLGPEYTLGPTFKWQLKAYYSAKLWTMSTVACVDSTQQYAYIRGDSTLGLGWTLQLGYVVSSYLGTIYRSPDGGRHLVSLIGTTNRTADGTLLRVKAIGSPATSYTVEFPDGIIETFSHSYTPPGPVPAGSSPDFTDWSQGEMPSPRLGLSNIKDSFGTTLLTVNYDAVNAWKVNSITLNPTGKTITLIWGTSPSVGGVTWPVLTGILFPAVGTSQLKVAFAYQGANLQRNIYDNSGNFGACPPHSPSNVLVPELQTMTFSDPAGSPSFTAFSSTFAYLAAASGDPIPVQQQGALKTITLPTQGTIDYAYGLTTQGACQIPGCGDPEVGVATSQTAAPGNFGRFLAFLDKSIAVTSRCESTGTTPCPNPATTTTYDRQQYWPYCAACNGGDPGRVLRRTTVIAPGNDLTGSTQYATRYYFHVGFVYDDGSEFSDGGIELERRVYPGSVTTATPVRSVISCWQGVPPVNPSAAVICGYHDSAGTLNQFNYGDLPPKKAEVTWYGAVPSGDGGTCPTGSMPCKATVHGPVATDYDIQARQFRTTTTSAANFAVASPTHTSYTTWAAFIDSTHWLLDRYDERDETESGQTIYRGFEFDTTGFGRGQWTSDQPSSSTNRSLLLDCRYQDTVGNPKWQFSATYPTATLNALGLTTPPFHNLCTTYYGSYPGGTVGTNNDSFGHVYTWSHGLLNSDKWVNGGSSNNPTTFSWSAFNVLRDSASGLISTSYDSSGVSTGYGYDALARLTSIAPQTPEVATTITYDTTTQTTVNRNGGTGLTTWQRYLYDGLGRLSREIRLIPTPTGPYAVRTHAYDSAGHRTFDSEWAACANPTGDCLSAGPSGSRYSNFDPFGRAQTVVRADGSTTTTSYPDGSILFSDTRRAVTVNNINGSCNGTCTGGTSNVTTTYAYDIYGRLLQVTEPPPGDVTTYTYDVNGKLTGVTQTPQTRTFVYDAYGFLRSETTPEKGTVDSTGTLANGNLKIGSIGNVRERTEGYGTGDAKTHDYTYDAAGRLSTETANSARYTMNCYDGSAAIPLCPDGTANFAGGSNPLGKLTRRVGSNPTVSPYPTVQDDSTYSGLNGRLSKLSTTVSGGIGQLDQSWFYNNLGLVAQHAHARPSSGSLPPLVISTVYNAGLPTTLYVNGIPAVTGVDYAPSGAVQHYTTGLFSGRTVTTTINPDATLMPRPASIATSGSISQSLGSYTYDGVGNIKTIGSDTFAYDNRSRLTSATLSGTGTASYTYDRFGNLLTKAGVTYCTTVCANNRLPAPWVYNGRGDLTHSSYPAEDYTYDALDRTTTVSSGWSYAYDGASERVVRTPPAGQGNPTYTLRDEASRVSAEYSGASPSIDNVFLGHQVVASYANAAVAGNDRVWAFYVSDHLGTPRFLTDASGAQFDTRKYWPFGEQVTATSVLERVRFASMERDPEAGTGNDRYYDHARHHGSLLGRFLSPDKVGGNPRNPQSWNRYVYASNNPVSTVDRNGLWPTKIHNEIINRAFPGLTTQQRQILMHASARMDNPAFGGQNSGRSYQHAMRAPGQSVEDAAQKASAFYRENVDAAKAAQEKSGSTSLDPKALESLGKALHTVSDATSPAHAGFQEWSPLRHPLEGTIVHPAGEETINANEMNTAVQMERAAFAEAFGTQALEQATTPPLQGPCQQNMPNCLQNTPAPQN